MDVTNRRYFKPRIERELHLVQNLEGRVEIEVNRAARKGVLQYYTTKVRTSTKNTNTSSRYISNSQLTIFMSLIISYHRRASSGVLVG